MSRDDPEARPAGPESSEAESVEWLFETHLVQRLAAHPELMGAVGRSIQLDVRGEQGETRRWLLDLRPGHGGVVPEGTGAGCTLQAGASDLLRIARGQLNPRKAFAEGRLRLAGEFEPGTLPALLRLLQVPKPSEPVATALAGGGGETEQDGGERSLPASHGRPEGVSGGTFVTVQDRPDLIRLIDAVTGGGWPEFMLHNAVAERYWNELCATFPDFQFALLETRSEEIVGVGSSVPLAWREEVDGWPQEGWNWAIEKAFADHAARRRPNVQCALSVTIDPSRRGKGLGRGMVAAIRASAAARGLEAVIAPLRPNRKSAYPLTPIERYIGWRRGDGEPFDPWIRAHTAVGAEVMGVCSRSASVTGSLREWEAWTGMIFPDSGPYVVPGALVPVMMDLASDRGTYVEPNVWVYHRLGTLPAASPRLESVNRPGG